MDCWQSKVEILITQLKLMVLTYERDVVVADMGSSAPEREEYDDTGGAWAWRVLWLSGVKSVEGYLKERLSSPGCIQGFA